MKPYDLNKWFSPRYAIYYLASLLKKHGEIVLTSGRYKKEREAWIMGLALLGINKKTGLQWWLQVPEEDPPDMRAMTMVPNVEKNWNEMNDREIEIVQITKFTDNSIEDEILRKLNSKSYIKETSLIVYMNRNAFISDMRLLAEKLKGKINISDIWVVAAVAKDSPKHILFSLYPDFQVVNFDMFEEMSKIPRGDQLDITRAKGTNMSLYENMPLTKFIPTK